MPRPEAGIFANQTAMTQDSDSIYSWSGTLTSGSFKIKTYPENDFCGGNWVHALTASAPLENGAVQILEGCADGNPDNQWSVASDTSVTITVNIADSTIAFSEFTAEQKAELFLVGDATPGGWDLGNQTAMEETSDSVFSWTGTLTSGNFKIKTYVSNDFCGGNWVHPTSGSAPLDDGAVEILEGCADGNPDNQWTVTSDTLITLKVDLKASTIDFSEGEDEVVDTMDVAFLVGSATPGGWDLASQTPMIKSDTDAGIFTYTDTLTAGEFKIKLYAENDFCAGDWMHPEMASQPLDQTEANIFMGCADGNPDYKWEIMEPGIYSVTANINDTTVSIVLDEPFTTTIDELYMVGSATPGGWDLGAQTALIKDSENSAMFTWQGDLLAGEMKIKTYAENDFCAGEWIHPTEENAPLSSTAFEVLIGCAATNPDYKWVVAEADTGEYLITVNVDSATIIFEKLNSNSNEEDRLVVEGFKLHQNYPNPFNPTTNITFEVPEASQVVLSVYDMLGRKVSTLIDRSLSVGAHTAKFDASSLSSGMYMYVLETSSSVLTKKMMLIK